MSKRLSNSWEVYLVYVRWPLRFSFTLTFNYILWLLRTYPGLEMIVIVRWGGYHAPECLNTHFHNEFVKLVNHTNAKLKFIERGQVFGIVTRNEIIRRGKLMHWIGYEPNYSKSNLNLLDLADLQKPSNPEKEDPFGVILSYLDLGSLYALSRANKRSEQLVESYVQRRFSQQGTFVITNEFKIDYNGLRVFGPYVNNFAIILHRNIAEFRSIVEKYCVNLRKLCFHSRTSITLYEFIFPQVRHMVYNTWFPASFDLRVLYEMSQICPDLETLELGKVDRSTGGNNGKTHLFRDLKKFKFKPSKENRVKLVKDLFKNMSKEVIVDN